MQAQIDRKWDSVYSYFDSSSRAKVTRESYVNQSKKLSCSGFAIEGITMLPSGDQAMVKVGIDILLMGYNFKGVPQRQDWVKERGEWFVKAPELQPRKNPFSSQEKQQ